MIALRNAVLVAVAYDTMLRRAELVSLRIEDLAAAEDGSGTVLVRSSKGDQEGIGAIKYLVPNTMGHVSAWLAAAGLAGAPLAIGPLFRPMIKGGCPGGAGLGDQEVQCLFRDVAAAAGVKLARPP